jgi:hypothetical protein
MDISLAKIESIPISAIREGQLFVARSVGNHGPGIFVKLNGEIWPFHGGVKAPEGRQYGSPGCPVVGYDPIILVS